MRKLTPKIAGLLQALAITVYVGVFAFLAYRIQQISIQNQVHPHPVVAIVLFLLAFIISAVVCGSLFLGYPVWLFFENKKLHAVKIVLWSALWLVAFFLILAVAAFVFLFIRFS